MKGGKRAYGDMGESNGEGGKGQQEKPKKEGGRES